MGASSCSCAACAVEDVEEIGCGVDEVHGTQTWVAYPGPVYVLKSGLTANDIAELRAEAEEIRHHHSAHIRGPFDLYDRQEASAKMLCTFNYYTVPQPTDPEPKKAFAVSNRFLRDFGTCGEACLTIQYPGEIAQRSLPFHVDLDGRGGPVLTMSWGAPCDFLWLPEAEDPQPACLGSGRTLKCTLEEGDIVYFDGGRIPHAVRGVGGERFNIQIREVGALSREGCSSSETDYLTDFQRRHYDGIPTRHPFGSCYGSWYVVEDAAEVERQVARTRRMYLDLLVAIIRNERSREPGRAPAEQEHDLDAARRHLEQVRSRFGDRMDASAWETLHCYVDLLSRADDFYKRPSADFIADLDFAETHRQKLVQVFGERAEIDLATVYGYFAANQPVAHSLGMRSQLGNTQACVERALADGVPGDLIETGVWQGGQTILMRGILKAYGIRDRKVFVADSFQGLPDVDAEAAPDDAIALGILDGIGRFQVTADDVRRNFAAYGLLDEQVVFLEGWFSETLPRADLGALAVVRLDGDFYDSTRDAIGILYPKLSPGGYIIIDDYGCPFGCKRAVDEYRSLNDIAEPMVRASNQTVYWRKPF